MDHFLCTLFHMDDDSFFPQHKMPADHTVRNFLGTHAVIKTCLGDFVNQIHGNHAGDNLCLHGVGTSTIHLMGVHMVMAITPSVRFDVLLLLSGSQGSAQKRERTSFGAIVGDE